MTNLMADYSLFVGLLPSETTKEELKNLFSECGDVQRVFVHRDDTMQLTHGFVSFSKSECVLRAVQGTVEWSLHGKILRVEIAHGTKQKLQMFTPPRHPSSRTVTRANDQKSRVKEACFAINKELDLVYGDDPVDTAQVVSRMEKKLAHYSRRTKGRLCVGTRLRKDHMLSSIGAFAEEPLAAVEEKQQKLIDKIASILCGIEHYYSEITSKSTEKISSKESLTVQTDTNNKPQKTAFIFSNASSDGNADHTTQTFKDMKSKAVIDRNEEFVNETIVRQCRMDRERGFGNKDMSHDSEKKSVASECLCRLPGNQNRDHSEEIQVMQSQGASSKEKIRGQCCYKCNSRLSSDVRHGCSRRLASSSNSALHESNILIDIDGTVNEMSSQEEHSTPQSDIFSLMQDTRYLRHCTHSDFNKQPQTSGSACSFRSGSSKMVADSTKPASKVFHGFTASSAADCLDNSAVSPSHTGASPRPFQKEHYIPKDRIQNLASWLDDIATPSFDSMVGKEAECGASSKKSSSGQFSDEEEDVQAVDKVEKSYFDLLKIDVEETGIKTGDGENLIDLFDNEVQLSTSPGEHSVDSGICSLASTRTSEELHLTEGSSIQPVSSRDAITETMDHSAETNTFQPSASSIQYNSKPDLRSVSISAVQDKVFAVGRGRGNVLNAWKATKERPEQQKNTTNRGTGISLPTGGRGHALLHALNKQVL